MNCRAAGPARVVVEIPPAAVTCAFHLIVRLGVTGKTVRLPSGARLKFGTGAGADRIWSRIFSEIAVTLCVVKRLASATSSGDTPAANAEFSASRTALRYAFLTGSFVWPKFRSCWKVGATGSPFTSRTPSVTTSR